MLDKRNRNPTISQS